MPKVQIDYRLHYAYTRTHAAQSNLPMDPCAACSLQESIVKSQRYACEPIDLYKIGGRRCTNTCRSCLESSLVFPYCTQYRCKSTLSCNLLALESLLESLLGSLYESLLDSLLDSLLGSLLGSPLDSLLERATLRKE